MSDKQDFCSDAWVMPKGWDRGAKKIFLEHGHVAYQIDCDVETKWMQVKIFTLGSNW